MACARNLKAFALLVAFLLSLLARVAWTAQAHGYIHADGGERVAAAQSLDQDGASPDFSAKPVKGKRRHLDRFGFKRLLLSAPLALSAFEAPAALPEYRASEPASVSIDPGLRPPTSLS